MKRLAWLLPVAAASCLGLNGIHYAFDPQEFSHDFGAPTNVTLPSIPCTTDMQCAGAQPPQGATLACDTTAKTCIATYDLRLIQPVNLSQQKGFPDSVVNAAVQTVSVDAVHYWTPTNTLTFDTPDIDVYVGAQAVQMETDPGATLLGTIPSQPANTRTACGAGAAGTQESECDVPLTAAGQNALGILARDYRTPFNVLVVAHVVAHAGEQLPAGKLDLYVQPVIAFGIPL
jgi:hypothetical protein